MDYYDDEDEPSRDGDFRAPRYRGKDGPERWRHDWSELWYHIGQLGVSLCPACDALLGHDAVVAPDGRRWQKQCWAWRCKTCEGFTVISTGNGRICPRCWPKEQAFRIWNIRWVNMWREIGEEVAKEKLRSIRRWNEFWRVLGQIGYEEHQRIYNDNRRYEQRNKYLAERANVIVTWYKQIRAWADSAEGRQVAEWCEARRVADENAHRLLNPAFRKVDDDDRESRRFAQLEID